MNKSGHLGGHAHMAKNTAELACGFGELISDIAVEGEDLHICNLPVEHLPFNRGNADGVANDFEDKRLRFAFAVHGELHRCPPLSTDTSKRTFDSPPGPVGP